MRIGIVTTHFLRNYGSVLQAYATKTVLSKLGHNVSVIDYKPDDFAKKSSKKVSYWSRVKRVLNSGGLVFAYKRKIRTKKFDVFRESELNLTQNFNGYSELSDGNLDFDAYICGSDQIWNPKNYGGLHDAFFLAFAPKNKIKIAYAPSVAVPKLTNEEKNRFSILLKNIDYISVRESSSVSLLEKLTNKKVEQVLDPALLLSKEDWDNLVQNVNLASNHGLVYMTEENSTMEKVISRLSKNKKTPIYNVSNNKDVVPGASNRFADIGPKEFVSLVRDSKFVITNSFHCVVFCLIYHVPFVAFSHSKENERFKSLLMPFGLEALLIDDYEKFSSDLFDIMKDKDKKIDKILDELRNNSLKFLNKALVSDNADD